jgi:hypothetical protein
MFYWPEWLKCGSPSNCWLESRNASLSALRIISFESYRKGLERLQKGYGESGKAD